MNLHEGRINLSGAQMEAVKELLADALDDPYPRRVLDRHPDALVRAAAGELLESSVEGDAFSGHAFSALDDLDLEPGHLVANRYRIDSVAGRGGFGTVYYARDHQLDHRAVALKVWHRGLATSTHFQRELTALAAIDHPGVVSVFDAGQLADGRPYFVTRWVRGVNLRERMRHMRSPDLEQLVLDLSEALEACHSHGILHRDIRPENLMHRAKDGRWLLIDFSEALLDPAQGPGPVARSPYSAPELHSAGHSMASDIFSLGAVVEEVRQQSRHRIPAWRWNPLIRALCHPDPKQRPRSAFEIRRLLPSRQRRQWRRWGAVAAAALSIAGVWVLNPEPVSPAGAPLAAPTPWTALPGDEKFPWVSDDGNDVYFAAPNGEGQPRIFRAGPPGSIPARWTAGEVAESGLVYSPDRQRILIWRPEADASSSLVIRDGTTGSEHLIARGQIHSAAWTPLGRAVITADTLTDGNRQLVYRPLDGHVRPVLLGARRPKYPAYSPDGKHLALVEEAGPDRYRILTVPVDSLGLPQGRVTTITEGRSIRNPSWTPDGRHILYLAGPDAARQVFVARTRPERPTAPVRVTSLGAYDHLATARQAWVAVLAHSHSQSDIWRVDLSTGIRRRIVASTLDDEEVRLSPDGSRIAFTTYRTGEPQLWVAAADGTYPGAVITDPALDRLLFEWVGTDQILAETTSNGVLTRRIVSVPSGAARPWLAPGLDRLAGVSRDRNYVYLIGGGLESGLWRVSVADPARRERISGQRFLRVVESLDGRKLWMSFRGSDQGLWHMPTDGSQRPERVDVSFQGRQFAALPAGLLLGATQASGSTLSWFRLNARLQPLVQLAGEPFFGLEVTADGRTAFVALLDGEGVDLERMDLSFLRDRP